MAAIGDTLSIKVDANTRSASRKLGNLNKKVSELNTNLNSLSAHGINLNVGGSGKEIFSNRGVGLLQRLKNGFSNLTKGINTSHNSMKSLAYYFSKFYANCFLIIRGLKSIGKAVKSSMDYIEEYNYFNVTVAKTGAEWGKEWQKYGYANAEEYSDSFRSRLTDTIGKMSGFNMNEDGTLSYLQNQANLGLDVTALTNYSAGLMQVTNSLKLTGETSVNTTKALTMLAGDLSSFRNVDLKTVMQNLQSGLIGQSRALYRYGIDITQATLQQYAYENGVTKSVSAMTQAEKMQLRTLAILDQSKVAYGDLANTLDSPSNQLRQLQTNFQSLGRTIGGLFLASLSKAAPYVNALVLSLTRLTEWFASLFHIDLKQVISNSGLSGDDSVFADMEDDTEDATDAVDDLSDAVDKYKNQLMGFDKINKLSDTTSDTSSSKSKSGASGSQIDLSDAISKALNNYEDIWNKALKGANTKAQKLARKLTKALKKAFKTSNFKPIGIAIAKGIDGALKSIKWDKVYANSKGFGKGLATFLNGLLQPALFVTIGQTIAGLINSAIYSAYELGKNIDTKQIGRGLGMGINSALKGIDFSKYEDTMTLLGDKISDFINSAIDTIDFSTVGSSIASVLNGAVNFIYETGTTIDFSKIGDSIGETINGFFKNFDFAKLATGLSAWARGLVRALRHAIKKTNFKLVGKQIGNFLKNLQWEKLLAEAAVAIWEGIVAALETWGSVFKTAPIETTIITAIALAKFTGLSTSLFTAMKPQLLLATKKTAAYIAFRIQYWLTAGGGALKLAGLSVAIVIAAVSISWARKKLKPTWEENSMEDIKKASEDMFTDWFGKNPLSITLSDMFLTLSDLFVDPGDIVDSLKLAWDDVCSGDFKFNLFNIMEFPSYNETEAALKEMFKDIGKGDFKLKIGTIELPSYNEIKKKISTLGKRINDAINNSKLLNEGAKILSKILKGARDKFKDAKSWFGKLPGRIGKAFGSARNTINKFTGKGGHIISGIFKGARNKFNNVSDWFKKLPDKFRDKLGSAKGLMHKFKSKGGHIMQGIKNGAVAKFEQVKAWFMNIPSKIRKAMPDINAIRQKLGNKGGALIQGLKEGAITKLEQLKAWFMNIPSKIRKAMPSAKDLGEMLKFKGMAFLGGFKKGVSDALSWFSDLPNKIVARIGNMYEKGKSVISNFIDGLKSLEFPSFHLTWDTESMAGKALQKVGITGFPILNFYANGGMPNTGEIFVARENGLNEMVGKIGTHSAVANNDQIVESITNGVAKGVAMAMSDNNNNVNVTIQGDTSKIFKVVQTESKRYTNRTGLPAF